MRKITIGILAGLVLIAEIGVAGQDGKSFPPPQECGDRERSCDPYKGTAGGVRLASDIVDLVGSIFAPRTVVVAPRPTPVVVTQPVVQYQQPVVVQQSVAQTVYGPEQPTVIVQTVPIYTYGYYNNVYVPYYGGWYYYGNCWCWGRSGPPPVPPRWRPCPSPYSRR